MNLQTAISVAVKAHGDQTDQSGSLYILHPLRVMSEQRDEKAKIVAVLHDVVEDTDVTIDDLQSLGFSGTILQAIRILTHDRNEPYMDYVRKVKEYPSDEIRRIAISVKLADIRDNSNPKRLYKLPEDKVLHLTKKYAEALNYLEQASEATTV